MPLRTDRGVAYHSSVLKNTLHKYFPALRILKNNRMPVPCPAGHPFRSDTLSQGHIVHTGFRCLPPSSDNAVPVPCSLAVLLRQDKVSLTCMLQIDFSVSQPVSDTVWLPECFWCPLPDIFFQADTVHSCFRHPRHVSDGTLPFPCPLPPVCLPCTGVPVHNPQTDFPVRLILPATLPLLQSFQHPALSQTPRLTFGSPV